MRRWILGAVLALLAASGPGAASTTASLGPVVHVSSGDMRGVRLNGVEEWLGVPYAAPPVGALRWRAPEPAKPWPHLRIADRSGPSCWQAVSAKGFGPWTHEYVVDGEVSEDCLSLNVWAPARRGSGRPVLVWFHGGGFSQGSGSVPIYQGAALALQGVVVVTVNYRLGVLGFFAHPELTREAAGGPTGNYGLMDMIAALKWVRANARAFGGDPDAVTIAGQSAGGMAVHDLIVSPEAKGLFRRAIIESGLPGVAPNPPLKEAEASGVAFAKAKGASGIAGLRALTPAQLSGGAPGFFAPMRDGVLLPAEDLGPASDTPVLVGVNADEGSAMSASYGTTDPAKLQALLKDGYGQQADRFEGFYAASTDAGRADASRRLLRDKSLAALYAWGQRRLGQSKSPVYAYLWTHPEPGPTADRYRAFHSSEIPYVFQTLDASPERPFGPDDRRLSLQVSSYWLNFVRTGDPNGRGLPPWPRLSREQPRIMALDVDPHARPILPPEQLKAVDAFLASGGQPRMF
jgi:para-nitrobenzyl esterase